MKGKILFNDVETYLFSDIFVTSFYMPFSQMPKESHVYACVLNILWINTLDIGLLGVLRILSLHFSFVSNDTTKMRF